MIKKLLTITLSLMMIFTSFVPVFAEGEEVNIVGQYGIVIDKDTGQVLYNKNAHDKMYPASITKILTCIVAIEMLDDLEQLRLLKVISIQFGKQELLLQILLSEKLSLIEIC